MKSTLMRLKEKTRTWLSPKHEFNSESIEFKEYYAAAVLLQTQLSDAVSPMDHFELLRLLSFGLGLGKEEVKTAISLSRNKEKVLERVLLMLDSPKKQTMFLMDLYMLSYVGDGFGDKEEQAIEIYGELFHFGRAEMRLIRSMIEAAMSEKPEECMNVYYNMSQLKMDCSLENVRYYIPELEYTSVIDTSALYPGRTVHINGQCRLREVLVIPKGCHVVFQNVKLKLSAPIIVEDAKVEIINSEFTYDGGSFSSMIRLSGESSLIVRSSKFYCRNYCGAILQKSGYLDMVDATFYESNMKSAVEFNGDEMVIVKCHFYECFLNGNGAAISSTAKRGMIGNCDFEHCRSHYGGAIYVKSPVKIVDSRFRLCHSSKLGNSIYYLGDAMKHVNRLVYESDYEERDELVQRYESVDDFVDVTEINCSTHFANELPLHFTKRMYIHDAYLYLNSTLKLSGGLLMEQCQIKPYDFTGEDLLETINGSAVEIKSTTFDGMGMFGGIAATGTKISMYSSVFKNTNKGRAIYNSVDLFCDECIFNNCLGGAVYGSRALIKNTLFVNCRADRGGGCYLAGSKGLIKNSTFEKCVAMVDGGAVSRFGNYQVEGCTFSECEPNDVK
ncbi:MAG: right-handed parallel beta-helix repeat-containing protein [Lachnospiraceae bacterium]|nr:right-handed parallel beta-helix repeat-containing protein [Lachnospiraceae bacterium]